MLGSSCGSGNGSPTGYGVEDPPVLGPSSGFVGYGSSGMSGLLTGVLLGSSGENSGSFLLIVLVSVFILILQNSILGPGGLAVCALGHKDGRGHVY